MRAAKRFAELLAGDDGMANVAEIRVELFGSLGATGKGHGSDRAILLGLEGDEPATTDIDAIGRRVAAIAARKRVLVLGKHEVALDPATAIVFHRRDKLPLHPNGMRFCAIGRGGSQTPALPGSAALPTGECGDRSLVLDQVYYSIGGGFVVDHAGTPIDLRRTGSTTNAQEPNAGDDLAAEVPYPFNTAAQLLQQASTYGLSLSSLMLENEKARLPESEVRQRVLELWRTMEACVQRGCQREGVLPGGLQVKRRAAGLFRKLKSHPAGNADPLTIMDWISLCALAVSEENASGGRVVTAPTNGAAGIIPAVMTYYRRFLPNADDEGSIRFLLAAAAIGALYKKNASISGAEVGCQGEVGVACSMAAGALAEVMGGTPAQVENAAEIGMEHNLGLTCDPMKGLVQVPCIERNAMGAVKAIHAARLALAGDGTHTVSLDKVIRTMRRTGADMSSKYKETARGGLAVNIVEC